MSSGTQAIERALTLVTLVAEAPRSAPELASAAGLNRSTAARILNVLERNQYVVRSGNVYLLGSCFLRFATVWNQQLGVNLAPGHLKQLVDEFEETASLSVREALEAVCIAKLESPRSMRLSLSVGSRTPLHGGAAAKALLGFAPEHVVEALLGHPLVRFTETTITDGDDLRRELSRVRSRGYAESHGEVDEGVTAVAAPIVDPAGEAVAAVALSGPDIRLRGDALRAARTRVVEVAESISRELRYEDASRANGESDDRPSRANESVR